MPDQTLMVACLPPLPLLLASPAVVGAQHQAEAQCRAMHSIMFHHEISLVVQLVSAVRAIQGDAMAISRCLLIGIEVLTMPIGAGEVIDSVNKIQ